MIKMLLICSILINMALMVVQCGALPPHSSFFDAEHRLVFVHVLLMSTSVSSGFLFPPKNMPGGGLAQISMHSALHWPGFSFSVQ